MNLLTMQQIKSRGAKAIPDDQTSYLIVNSKPKSAIVPIKEYEMLINALEELEDIKAIESRKNEKVLNFEEAFK